MPEMPPAPGQQGQQPQQPPFGANPASQATPNRGYEAAALQKLGVILKEMESLVPMFGATSEPGKDVISALSKLAKHIPTGAVSPASQKNVTQDMMLKNQQNAAMMQRLQQQKAQGQAA
jgi:hypothetical protein